ncbi:hypothetical protein CEUSTIGMA_g4091.t1 [Chlamydomonas eustigma]|uniref:Uncharacterized protein n=1 Tax=Chlamydomonas eustigma TaxID=1157962 RepID=A0A250X0R9_9CHLO|nr:hypothetical protein CEUSTIGMA_g4091.t1 [Chlamydomonas eustigma]|eukprot:GAX76645.1 hypothetical protein CEUSTIGMA_g4091.t1 [Chlamydomonas eustigma]
MQPSTSYSSTVDAKAKTVADEEAAKFDEFLQTAELRDFLSLLEKGNYKEQDLDDARQKVGFRRSPDGRVMLKARDGQWFMIKNDMQSPGFILLRGESDGHIYFLPADESGRLMQIDLSDDAVVSQLFGSGAWQDVIEEVKIEEEGVVTPLVLPELDFRVTETLMEGIEEREMEM